MVYCKTLDPQITWNHSIGRWVQDVLRHTYASFHAKNYADLPRLQLNMGHRDQSLLRSRYINMHGISRAEAKSFFN